MASNKQALGKGVGALFTSMAVEKIQTEELVAPPSHQDQKPVPSGASGQTHQKSTPLEGVHTSQLEASSERVVGISLVDPKNIKLNPFQPRKEFDEQTIRELAESISISGIIQPLVVRRLPQGEIELIAGERRLRAAKLLGLQKVPVVLRRVGDKESLEVALVENIQRENLNCIDEAYAYQRLQVEFSLSHEEIAKRVGKDRVSVTQILRLLKLAPVIRDMLRSSEISFGHAKVLLSIESMDEQIKIARRVKSEQLSVRALEKLIKSMDASPTESPNNSINTKELSAVMTASALDAIRLKFQSKPFIKGTRTKGSITFSWDSERHLADLIEKLI